MRYAKSFSALGTGQDCTAAPGRFSKDIFCRRWAFNFSTSTSATVSTLSRANRSPSAKMPPFSATKVAPLNTRSVVLSCTPAPAYTYPATQRADWPATRSRR